VVNPLLAGDAQSKVRDTSRRIDRKKILLDSFFRAFGLIQKHQKIKHGEKQRATLLDNVEEPLSTLIIEGRVNEGAKVKILPAKAGVTLKVA